MSFEGDESGFGRGYGPQFGGNGYGGNPNGIPMQNLDPSGRYALEENYGRPYYPPPPTAAGLSGINLFLVLVALVVGLVGLGFAGASWTRLSGLENEINGDSCFPPCLA